jgi:hypothetical protein
VTQLVGGEFICDCCELVCDDDGQRGEQLVLGIDSRYYTVDLCPSCWMDHFQRKSQVEYWWRKCTPETPE